MDLKFTLRFAEQIALKAGERVLQLQQNAKVVKFKDRQDIVTSADLEAERIIITKLKSIYPSHGIYSEEKGEEKSESEYHWIIDPIDGSKEYLRGLPFYNTCFSLEKNGQSLISVLYQPANKTLYSAAKGIGAFVNSEPVKLSAVNNLKDSIIYVYLPNYSVDEKKSEKVYLKYFKLSRLLYRIRASAEEASAMCWVASGKTEAFISLTSNAQWYDYAAGLLIAKESGAKISDLKGNAISKENFKKNGIVVSNNKIHADLLKIINK